MPNYAFGQQVSKTDDRIKAEYVTVPSPQGNGGIKGYIYPGAVHGFNNDATRERYNKAAADLAW